MTLMCPPLYVTNFCVVTGIPRISIVNDTTRVVDVRILFILQIEDQTNLLTRRSRESLLR